MTTFLLVRHAAHDWLGKGLAGRLPGVELNAVGRRQADELVTRLAATPIDSVYSSPQPRALQTAGPLAAARQLEIRRSEAFDEIDFGEWTGLGFERLRCEPGWPGWVDRRSTAAAPGGESFAQVQQRALSGIYQLGRLHPHGNLLVVSHGDVIKAVLAVFLGLSMDHLERFDVAPASLSIVVTGPDWSQVRLVNGPADGPLA